MSISVDIPMPWSRAQSAGWIAGIVTSYAKMIACVVRSPFVLGEIGLLTIAVMNWI